MLLSDLISPAIAGAVTFVLAGAGWIWHLSAKSAEIEYVSRRVAVLETRVNRIDEIADRLARLEPMVSYLVDQLKASQVT